MIVVMRKDALPSMVDAAIRNIEGRGFSVRLVAGEEEPLLGVLGEGDREGLGASLRDMDGVQEAIAVAAPYTLASRRARAHPTVVTLAPGVRVGGGHFTVMAGPCAVEDTEQLMETAEAVKQAGAQALRGGAFKPRTSPYSFQGLGSEGLRILKEARDRTGLAIVTEVMDTRDVEEVSLVADVLQVGSRNMQNFPLLREVGQSGRPILLKRGFSATYEEWLMSAEYILAEGNDQVVLCERGIRTFEDHTRNTFDVAAIPAVHGLSHLPVVADPSHGTGRWRMVTPVALAAVAAGADGLIVEVHPRPKEALSDGAQSLTTDNFLHLMAAVRQVSEAVGRIPPK